ncbi:MAG: redox-regulated ATPase YchF [Acidobacteriota bacterium]
MKMGVVGFPAVGKTTLFNLLTDSSVTTSRFGMSGRADPNIGMTRVPDDRLEGLSALFSPRKTTPATIEYVDLAGLRKEETVDGLALAPLRNADALLHVVRAFEDESLVHAEGNLDPARDIATMETALLLSDHAVLSKRIQRLQETIPKTGLADDRKELDLLLRVMEQIESEKPIREFSFQDEEHRRLRGFAFLSAKPILHLINMGEKDLDKLQHFVETFHLEGVKDRPWTGLLPLSARIEEEIAQLSPPDAAAFQADLGLPDPCRPRVIRASYQLVGLISFFTAGEDECRAWSIPAHTPAREAAGVIHSDIQRGFIRAEVIRVDDLLKWKNMAAVKEKGLLRLEGKEYIVQDGDVINFRFNV